MQMDKLSIRFVSFARVVFLLCFLILFFFAILSFASHVCGWLSVPSAVEITILLSS